jgi:hypothetical protein
MNSRHNSEYLELTWSSMPALGAHCIVLDCPSIFHEWFAFSLAKMVSGSMERFSVLMVLLACKTTKEK